MRTMTSAAIGTAGTSARLAAVFGFLLVACATREGRVRQAAARDLCCPEEQIEVVKTQDNIAVQAYRASGCGSQKGYSFYKGDGPLSRSTGNPQCAP